MKLKQTLSSNSTELFGFSLFKAIGFRHLSCIILSLLPFFLEAQSMRSLEKINTNSIVVRQSNQLTKAHILLDNSDLKARHALRYFYYSRGTIQHIQGGYHGHLLHGEYCSFIEEDRLQVQGWFKNGLKHGLWKEWNDAGDLVKEVAWHKGKVKGPFIHFSPQKNQIVKGHNRNGLLHGKIKTYQSGELTIISNYRKGELKSTKEAVPFLEKVKGVMTKKEPKEKKEKKVKKEQKEKKKAKKEEEGNL